MSNKPESSEVSRASDGSASGVDAAVPTEAGLYWMQLRSPASGNIFKPVLVHVKGKPPYLSMILVYPHCQMEVDAVRVVASKAITVPDSL